MLHGERFLKATQTLERVSATVSQFRPLCHPRAKQAPCKQTPRRPDSEAKQGPASTNHAALPLQARWQSMKRMAPQILVKFPQAGIAAHLE